MKSHNSDRRFGSVHESPIKSWGLAGFLKVIICLEATDQMKNLE